MQSQTLNKLQSFCKIYTYTPKYKQPPMNQDSSSRQSTSFQLKRQQFHTSIRRQQLDQYRHRKRQQLFGHISKPQSNQSFQNTNQTFQSQNSGNNNNSQHPYKIEVGKIENFLPQTLMEKLTYSPYPFNEPLKQFLIEELYQKLSATNYKLEVIDDALNIFVRSELSKLAYNEEYDQSFLPQILRIIAKMLKKINQIPKMSQLRLNSQSLIQDIYRKIAFSVKFIIIGMINQQSYLISSIHAIQVKKQYFSKIINNKQKQPKGVSFQALQQQMHQMEMELSTLRNPLECCNSEIKEILIEFFEIFNQNELLSSQSQSPYQKELSTVYIDYFMILSYMASFFSSSLFTADFFELYLQQIGRISEIQVNYLDLLMETLSNFVFLETSQDWSFSNRKQNSQQIIRYSNQAIAQTIQYFSFCLQNFEVSPSSVNALVKSLLHSFQVHGGAFMPFFMNNKIIPSLIQLLNNQKIAINSLQRQLSKREITREQFIDKVEKECVGVQNKKEIYQLLGAIFSFIKSPQEMAFYHQYIPCLQELVHYQFSRLFNQESQQMDELRKSSSISEKQDILESVMFMFCNLLGFSVEVVNTFIQKNILKDLMDIWNYLHHIASNVSNPNSNLYNHKKSNQMLRAKTIVIESIYNIIVMLTIESSKQAQDKHTIKGFMQNLGSNELNNFESLDIIVEYKNCGMLKLLVHFLKSEAYELQNAYIDKEAVKYALQTVRRLLGFILLRQKGEILIQNFSNSNQFSLTMFKEVLNVIMISDNTYEQKTTELALHCLQKFDMIMKDCHMSQYLQEGGYYEEKHVKSEQYVEKGRKTQQDSNEVEI